MKVVAALAPALLSLLASGHALGASLICAAERSTGFRYENGRWNNANFNVDGENLVLSPTPGDPDGLMQRYVVKKLGRNGTYVECFRIKTAGVLAATAYCGDAAQVQVTFNFQTMRYQEVYSHGFLDALDGKGDTPAITVGRCTELPN